MKKSIMLIGVLGLLVVSGFQASEAAKPGTDPEICGNGIDDDRDKKIDCADPDCLGDDACPINSCSDYKDKESCSADPDCQWVGKGGAAHCEGSLPALPPVYQNIGIPDTSFENLMDRCTFCHDPVPGDVPIENIDPTVHHTGSRAQGGDCAYCHGTIVDRMDDGHYIPTSRPNLVTPWPSNKEQSGPNGEGNCVFCHHAGMIDDLFGTLVILDNSQNHHNTGLHDRQASFCHWCHDVFTVKPASLSLSGYSIRTCEKCHGIQSLHNIQVDSNGDGIKPGYELPNFGHIGSNSDCFGCHGFQNTTTSSSVAHKKPSAMSHSELHHQLMGMPIQPGGAASDSTTLLFTCTSCHPLRKNFETGRFIIAPATECSSCH